MTRWHGDKKVVAKIWQKLAKKNGKSCKQMSKVAKKLLKIAKSYQEIPKIAVCGQQIPTS